jgi:hypothetical protein
VESTKAKIQEVVKQLYVAMVKAIPPDIQVEPLKDDEEVEGMICMFFTSDGTRGLTLGLISENEVLAYLAELHEAKLKAIQQGKNVVSSDAVDAERINAEGMYGA